MRLVVQRLVGQTRARLRAEPLLHRIDLRDQPRERRTRSAAALDPRSRHVRAVPGEAGPGVHEQALRRLRAFRVAHMVQRGRVGAQGDNVLVRRVRVVLLRRAQEGEVQLQLGAIAVREQPAQVLVSRCRPAIRLRDALLFVRRLVHAQLVERCDELRRIHVRDAPGLCRRDFVPDERDVRPREQIAHGRRRARFHHVERAPEMVRLRRGERLPEVRLPKPQQAGLAPGLDYQRAAGLHERQPVLELGRDAQWPVLIVGLRPFLRCARMHHQRVVSVLPQRLPGIGSQPRDVRPVQPLERVSIHRGIVATLCWSAHDG